MTPEQFGLLITGIFVIAILYSSVGHAGASGYLAVMALAGLAPADIKPTALMLNILVASIGAWQFWRAGHFSWPVFWPFALLAVPFAFLGGYLNLPTHIFKALVGIVLLFSAARFFFHPPEENAVNSPARGTAMAIGAGLGLLSGLTGTGGGIFLTPLLIFMRWATVKRAAAISSLFILLNSLSGLAGNISSTKYLPPFTIALAFAAITGGTIGSYFGSRHFPPVIIKRLLAVVLVIAGTKLILAR